MSRQARKRRERHSRSGGTRLFLLGGGLLAGVLIVGAIAAIAYVLHVAQSAPALDKLRPLLSGGSSQVFASDGTRLGFIQSDELRTPVGWSRDPPEPQGRDGGDRGSALLQAQRRRPHGHLPRGGQGRHPRRRAAGRLDDHDAADAQPLPRRRPAHAQAEDHRGQARARLRESTQQALDPHQLPQQRPLRHRRRPDGGRRAGGRADLLRQARLAAQPPAVGAARRAAAGAVAVQPVPRPRRGEGAAQRGAREDGRAALHHARAGRRDRGQGRWRRTRVTSTRSAARTSSSNTCASCWCTATARRP